MKELREELAFLKEQEAAVNQFRISTGYYILFKRFRKTSGLFIGERGGSLGSFGVSFEMYNLIEDLM